MVTRNGTTGVFVADGDTARFTASYDRHHRRPVDRSHRPQRGRERRDRSDSRIARTPGRGAHPGQDGGAVTRSCGKRWPRSTVTRCARRLARWRSPSPWPPSSSWSRRSTACALYAEATTARTFGSDTFLIAQVASPGRVSRRELQEQLQRNPPIRRAELRLPRAATPADVVDLRAERADPRRGLGGRVACSRTALVTGTTSALADMRDLASARGRFFRADEDRGGARSR